MLEQLRARQAESGEHSDYVELDNRGYNYGPAPASPLEEILADRIRPDAGTR